MKDIFRDEKGITTAGMAVSLMLCLTLIFSGAQLYRVSSTSAEIQEVADVAALAAENEVAEFMIAVKVCDAAVLSMTLLAATVYGIGVVAACVPPLAALSEQLISLAGEITQARDRFAHTAIDGLNTLQKALPFLAAASAAGIASANNHGAMDANYYAIAVLVPQNGAQIGELSGSSLADLGSKVESDSQEIRDAAKAAEDLAKKASEAKAEAFAYDCGNKSSGAEGGRCQYERAERLSSVSVASNPFYSSVDAWSFSVALARAKAYYSARSHEPALGGSVADMASYHLRKRFYRYAYDQMATARASETDSGSDVYFPKLFRNTEEMKSTPLYTEAVYPVTGASEGSKGVMHAYAGCPAAVGIAAYDSIKALDDGRYVGCAQCGFEVQSMGKIALASTSVNSGFEYHYERIRQASERYQAAMDELSPLKAIVKDKVNPILDSVKEVIAEASVQRISATPPGSGGAVAIVVNTARNAADTGFESAFVAGGGAIGTRAAVAGAALVEDTGHDDSTVITSLLDGVGDSGGAAVGAARVVLDCWSWLLKAYADGQSALSGALESGLNSLSMGTSSGLGTWAKGALESVVEAAGLQPAELKALKPALLNTAHVAGYESDGFTSAFSQVKAQALAASSSSTDMFTGMLGAVSDSAKESISGAEITVAEIEFPVGGVKIPIKIALPQAVKDAASGWVDSCFEAISGAISSVTGQRVWQ